MRRTTIKSRPTPKPAVEFSETVRRTAMTIAGHRCAARLAGCSVRIEHFHHRRMRSAGGLGDLDNCLPVCARCHRRIHDHPGFAYLHGLLVRRHKDPADIAVISGCGVGCREDHAAQ